MQEPVKPELESRVEKLELRIEILEKILFSSAKLTNMQAQRQLDEAQAHLKNSQALFARGMITELQLQQDRYRMQEAQKALEFANADSRQHELVGELEVLEAEQRLRQVQQQLLYTETLASRGFSSQTRVDSIKKLVDIATQELENSKIKLDAAKELEALKNK